MTNKEILQKLVAAGMRSRYGDHPAKQVLLRYLWEMKHIIDAGYVDYYLMAFWIFRHYADSAGIGFWARGAMPSSFVCYALMLTDIDPVKYGLHSVRFVNDELPKFQFDIEASRFDEFMNKAEELLQAHSKSIDVVSVKSCLFQDLCPSAYLSRKHERPLPKNLDDELACYALYFPDTMELYESYIWRKDGDEIWMETGIERLDEILASTYGLLVYQEQMLYILKSLFKQFAIPANLIRHAIQWGDKEHVEKYKAELFTNLQDLTAEEAEKAWEVLISNPKAFLKAHAVSRVLAKYKYEVK